VAPITQCQRGMYEYVRVCTSRQPQLNVYYYYYYYFPCDKWVPVTTAWGVLGLRMEERPPIWRVAANISNKQSRTADKGWSSSLGVWRGADNCSPLKLTLLRNIHKASDPDCYFGMDWIELAQYRDRCRTFVNAVMNLRIS
jgi:hypothetical protein